MTTNRKLSSACLALLLLAPLVGRGGDGHDHGKPPQHSGGGGPVRVKDIEFLDLGEKLDFGGRVLERKTHVNSGVFYFYSEKSAALPGKVAVVLPSTKEFSGLSDKESVDVPKEVVEIKSPGLDQETVINRAEGLEVIWTPVADAKDPSVRVQIIVESLAGTAPDTMVIGRIVVDSKDFGDFRLDGKTLAELPAGPARIAIKRIRLMGLKLGESKTDIVTVYSVTSRVGALRLR